VAKRWLPVGKNPPAEGKTALFTFMKFLVRIQPTLSLQNETNQKNEHGWGISESLLSFAKLSIQECAPRLLPQRP